MATAEHGTDFAIESQADKLLNNFSRDISNIVLRIASDQTVHHTPSGTPLVTRGDIIDALTFLEKVLQECETREDTPSNAKTYLAGLRQKIASLCVEAGDAK